MNRFIYLFLGGIVGLVFVSYVNSSVPTYAVTNTWSNITWAEVTWQLVTWVKSPTPQKKVVTTTHTNLPERISETQTVQIYWFPEGSLANQLATRYYREAGRDMLLTMLWENGWFNVDTVSPTHDYWLCQLNYAASSQAQRDFINSDEFHDPQKQADYCIRKFNVAASKNIRVAYKSRWNHARKVTIVDIVDDWGNI
jgi:hypothetical protein